MAAKSARIICALVLTLLVGIPGCTPAINANGGKSTETEKPDRETWDIYMVQGNRIGYGRTSVTRVTRSGRQLLRVEGLIHMVMRRFGKDSKQEIRFNSLETPGGGLVEFEVEMEQGPVPVTVTGKVVGDLLKMETTSKGKTMTSEIPWKPEFGGFYAPEQTLLEKPMKPGEKRTIHTLVVGFFQVATIEMQAKDYESVKLPTGMHNLLRIDTTTRFPKAAPLEGAIWTDRTGETLKCFLQAMNQTVVRVTKEIALEKMKPSDLDFGFDIAVKLDRPIENPHETKQIRYRVELEGGDPAAVFASGISQKVKSTGPHTAEVTVYAVRPSGKNVNPDAPADPPTRADREPNNYIQSDDARVVADAKKAAGDEKDPWRVAVALEKYVRKEVENKDFSQVFATAAEVAESREGDCSEHAVFLAALARARGIPARTAFGLVYLGGNDQAFFYHMWTEVYIEDRWIPLDATLGKGGIGAAHLKLGSSDLEGATAMSALLPVIQVIGRLKIEQR